jgi:hypothetical protein
MLLTIGRSKKAAAGEAMFHMDDGHNLKFFVQPIVNDPISAFMNLTQAGFHEFMDREMKCEWREDPYAPARTR